MRIEPRRASLVRPPARARVPSPRAPARSPPSRGPARLNDHAARERRFAAIALSPRVARHLRAVGYGRGSAKLRGRVYDIVGWRTWSIPRQVAFIRAFIEDTSRDPHLVELAVSIFRRAGVDQRQHERQWAALLAWVRRNVYYVNEQDERLQSPQATLSLGFGDCDDMLILLAALGASVRLPWRIVISGVRMRGGRPVAKVRWIEGVGPLPRGVTFTHIYGLAGWPPFRPSEWAFMEPTLPVPFGWDVVSGNASGTRGGRRLSAVPERGRSMVGLGHDAGSEARPTPVRALSPALERAGRELHARVQAQNRGRIDWVGFDGRQWSVHMGGCVQVPLTFPRRWAGYPVVRIRGGIVAVAPPRWSWRAHGRSARFGATAVTSTNASEPPRVIAAPIRFVVQLPWAQIVAATLPAVLGAWAIGRFVGQQGRERGRVRRAA